MHNQYGRYIGITMKLVDIYIILKKKLVLGEGRAGIEEKEV